VPSFQIQFYYRGGAASKDLYNSELILHLEINPRPEFNKGLGALPGSFGLTTLEQSRISIGDPKTTFRLWPLLMKPHFWIVVPV
jgi:hypothetical protein